MSTLTNKTNGDSTARTSLTTEEAAALPAIPTNTTTQGLITDTYSALIKFAIQITGPEISHPK